MTNINCSSNCVYQKEGKCHLDHVYNSQITSNQECVYYHEKEKEKEKEKQA